MSDLAGLQRPEDAEAGAKGGHGQLADVVASRLLAEVGVGSLVRGPLGVHRLTKQRYSFLDPALLKPVGKTLSEQMDFLMHVQVNSINQVAAALARLVRQPWRPDGHRVLHGAGDWAPIEDAQVLGGRRVYARLTEDGKDGIEHSLPIQATLLDDSCRLEVALTLVVPPSSWHQSAGSSP